MNNLGTIFRRRYVEDQQFLSHRYAAKEVSFWFLVADAHWSLKINKLAIRSDYLVKPKASHWFPNLVQIYIRSTNLNRTIISAMSLLYGMFPPGAWNIQGIFSSFDNADKPPTIIRRWLPERCRLATRLHVYTCTCRWNWSMCTYPDIEKFCYFVIFWKSRQLLNSVIVVDFKSFKKNGQNSTKWRTLPSQWLLWTVVLLHFTM